MNLLRFFKKFQYFFSSHYSDVHGKIAHSTEIAFLKKIFLFWHHVHSPDK